MTNEEQNLFNIGLMVEHEKVVCRACKSELIKKGSTFTCSKSPKMTGHARATLSEIVNLNFLEGFDKITGLKLFEGGCILSIAFPGTIKSQI